MMRLSELRAALDKCAENAGDYDPWVEVIHGEDWHSITSIGHFGVVCDVVISIGDSEDSDVPHSLAQP